LFGWFNRRYYDIHNAVGSLVTSSIDTNGKTILGNISKNELRKQSAEAYYKVLTAQDQLEKVNERIQKVENTPMNIPVDLNQYNKDIAERDSLIKIINSPENNQLVDAYKQFYVLDRKPWISKFLTGVSNAIEVGTTYDKYKQGVLQS